MSQIITVRDSDIIAAEINTIKEDTRRVMIANAIRIGGKLTEAKSMVDHGEWGKWLEEKVEYSQSTANNLMQLYREYGNNQESLFDNWTKSQTFANLSYTQHMAMLALPFADRMEFAESHNVEEMSTRELERAIREELEKTKGELVDAKRELHEKVQREWDLEKDLRSAEEDADILREGLAKAEAKVSAAETKEKEMLAHLKKLQNDLQEAKATEEQAKERAQKAAEAPEVPETVMEKLRQEAAEEAAKEAASRIEQEVEKAKQDVAAANKAREEAERKLAQQQKAAAMANPDVAVFKALLQQVKEDFNRLQGVRKKIQLGDADMGTNLRTVTLQLLEKLREEVGE